LNKVTGFCYPRCYSLKENLDFLGERYEEWFFTPDGERKNFLFFFYFRLQLLTTLEKGGKNVEGDS
jgi:hypothetical protein